MLKINPETDETLLVLEVSRKISEQDSKHLDSELHRRKDLSGDSRLVMFMDNFDGYESREALGTDLKIDLAHKDDFKKIAIIGDDHWERGLSKLADMISDGEVEFFTEKDKAEAMAWAKA